MKEEIISFLKSGFEDSILNIALEGKGISVKAKKEGFYEILASLKKKGFDHLSDVTCIDYIEGKEFEIIYHLWSHENRLRGIVKVRIPRDSPSIKSVVDLWPGGQIHERENHELFGIKFLGNPNLSPLFLEEWKEVPPLRKDFNTREFVRREYYERG
jgi:NADH-quinone oxidoreductase subunit C